MEATSIFIQAPTEAHGTADEPEQPTTPGWANDPFSTPASSRPSSIIRSRYSISNAPRSSVDTTAPSLPGGSRPHGSSSSIMAPSSRRYQQRMKSHMVPDFDNVPKPWLTKKTARDKFAYWIVYVLVFIGLAGGALQAYMSYSTVLLDKQPLCLVMEEDFNSDDAVFGANGSFMREVRMDGFGNGEFEMTTASTNNSYVQNGMLYIVPTLTADNIGNAALFDGTIYNITGCTFNQTEPNNGFIIDPSGNKTFDIAGYERACSAVSNKTAGTIINPVQSARLTTKGKSSINTGRVEIRAKMPTGDWLWPAMWMLPVDSVYGPWPLSGEIDMVESRGNGIRYTARGSNYVQGSLNWGPTPELNGVSKTYSWWSNKRVPFSDGFHTYALEWTDKFIRVYVDTRLHTLLELKLNEPFFQRGDFPDIIFNGSNPTALTNPWINGTNATPFDQEFYLILNVAVGGTNGWFPESQGNKPWLNNAANPMTEFATAISQWYPTWPTNVEDRAMVIDYVKMWKHC